MWYAERAKMRYDAVDRNFCDAIKFVPDKMGRPKYNLGVNRMKI
jgi:hypothetical protein